MRRLTLLLAVLFAVPLFAQTTHTISRIEVRGDVPARVVTTQTALVEGRSYTDDDLQVAMGRLRRLPFVFDATYRVDGTTLVIEVDGVTRLFGELDASATGFEGHETGGASLTGGGRFFLGSGGVAQGRVSQFVAEGGEDGTSADLGYTHYGIAGTRLFAGASVGDSFRTDRGFDPDPTVTLFAGYPLTVRQTLRADYVDQGYRARNTIFGGPRALNRSGDRNAFHLRWNYDTTEDPFFSRRGLAVFAGPSFSDERSQFDIIIFDPADGPAEILNFNSEIESRSVDVGARKFWARGDRGAIFADAAVSFFRAESTSNILGLPGNDDVPVVPSTHTTDGTTAAIGLGYAHNLFDFASHPALRHRVEAGATYVRRYVDRDLVVGEHTINSTSVNAAYVLRREFATVRLTLSYLFD